MTRLVLIRHAPTRETGVRLTGRGPGVSLGADGLDTARRLGERLAPVPLRAVYSSPLERTMETAAAVAAPHRLEPVPHEGLLEIDYGDWTGRTLRSLSRLKAWATVVHTPSRMRFPNGETMLEAATRVVTACEDIAARHREKTVALVTHADVIKLVTSHILGQPLDLYQRIAVAPASATVIDLPTDGPPRLVAQNTNGDPATWR